MIWKEFKLITYLLMKQISFLKLVIWKQFHFIEKSWKKMPNNQKFKKMCDEITR